MTKHILLFCMATLALVACSSSGGGGGTVERAENNLSAKQQALADARSTFAAKTDAFCTASQTYIVALDRYGDVLNDTAPTVADVNEVGADLVQPSEAAISAAEAAVAAQEQVVMAKQDLAEAEAELASARAATSGSTTTVAPTTPKSPTPLAPTATVNRVKQAEADFQAARNGIAAQTPLVEASQQFNAAAVALEMSWLTLFADAGCLTNEQQKKAEAAVHDYTQALQESLADAGYYEGQPDGIYGPTTVDAVETLQKAHDLPVTGTVDKATDAALQAELQAKGGIETQRATASTAAVQQTLKITGFWTGPVDGKWTPALTKALKAFQTELGVKPSGAVDTATVVALEHAIATAEENLSTATAAAESETTSSAPATSESTSSESTSSESTSSESTSSAVVRPTRMSTSATPTEP